MTIRVAALYVQPNGCYYGLPDVDPWDEARDARKYAGPHPVVAHPPCARWSRYWFGGPMWIAKGNEPKKLGDDGGCFAAALDAVRRFGGVLEHPAHSHAWGRFALNYPPDAGGWTCRVEQGHYGHKARKATWLYAFGMEPPSLTWGVSDATAAWAAEKRSNRSISRALKEGLRVLLSHKERSSTPEPFRDILLGMARSVHRG